MFAYMASGLISFEVLHLWGFVIVGFACVVIGLVFLLVWFAIGVCFGDLGWLIGIVHD